ncbi:Flp family type IVb pilin [Nocardioides sp. Leaf374]|uniref:Flp family type IVb pilin n=1 Tax=Nocardioides sp. Leaf374 TaxID=2876560 RepID=UPI001E4DECCE|nr:Flp family type IVb pilin [Nocardioides sp. Leaf374]
MITYLSILLNALRIDRDDERGASAVEYGLLIAGIAALIVVVVFAFGGTISGIFEDTCGDIGGAAADCDGPAPAGG